MTDLEDRPVQQAGHSASPLSTSPSDASSDVTVTTVLRKSPSPGSPSDSVPLSPAPRRFVHFQIDESATILPPDEEAEDGNARWTYDEDFLNSSDDEDSGNLTGSGRAPLLTNMDAPSVLAAESDIGELGDINRPKSGMKMAFMNMANSIM